MEIKDVMTQQVQSCSPEDSLQRAAELMWNGDLGAVPVVDANRAVVGMITDRDICMAACLRGGDLGSHSVASAMSQQVQTCASSDSVATVQARMGGHQIRRMPIVEDGKLVGIVTLNDLALAASAKPSKGNGLSREDVASTLARISQHRALQAQAAE